MAKALRIGLVLMLALGCGRPAEAATAGEPASASAPPDDPVGWVAQRVRNAKAGRREIVRIPLARRGSDWGCRCPGYYIGVSTASEGGIAWLDTSYEPGVREGRPARATRKDGGYLMVAEGYFTGTKENVGDKDEYDGKYELVGFHVLRWRAQAEEPDDALTLVLSGPQVQEKVAELSDDRPWLAVVDSLALYKGSAGAGPLVVDQASAVRAGALRDRLVAAGWSKAEVIDSRQARLLFCCYRVVLAGRYKDRAAAMAEVVALKKKGFAASVRLGW